MGEILKFSYKEGQINKLDPRDRAFKGKIKWIYSYFPFPSYEYLEEKQFRKLQYHNWNKIIEVITK